MQQVYHSNVCTNVHIRKHIQAAGTVSNEDLSLHYERVSKWESCDFTTAAFCAPHNIAYALSDTEMALAVSMRRSTWFALDEVFETSLSKTILSPEA